VFALKERQLPNEAAGRMLNVDYVVVGALRVHGDRLSVEVQLDETRPPASSGARASITRGTTPST